MSPGSCYLQGPFKCCCFQCKLPVFAELLKLKFGIDSKDILNWINLNISLANYTIWIMERVKCTSSLCIISLHWLLTELFLITFFLIYCKISKPICLTSVITFFLLRFHLKLYLPSKFYNFLSSLNFRPGVAGAVLQTTLLLIN